MSSKRPRSSSSSSSRSSTSPPSSPSSKLLKVIPDTLYASLTCTLSPTCSHPHRPTQLSSAHDVEEHYTKYHTHVCEHERCKSVFPDARFLELHFAECHDPIIALKKERGEKIFACYLTTCSRFFMTPKGRRLHLIQAHGYPKQYFFSVTNKGIGGLLHKWGQGASLYRGDWRPRSQDHDIKIESESEDESRSESGSEMDVEDDRQRKVNGRQRPPHMDANASANDVLDDSMTNASSHSTILPPHSARSHAHTSPESDTLANAMSSLTLVPDKIRFGRGGKKGGFAQSRLTKSAKTGRGTHLETSADSIHEKSSDQNLGSVRGRGGRRRTQRKPSEGTSSTSGELDTTIIV